jgi:hypothetical protein
MWLSLLHIWSETCYAWKIYFHAKYHIYAKFYPCFMIQMVSNHIYIFCFSKHVHVPHIYIFYWPYAKIDWISIFRAVSKVFGTTEAVFTGNVRPMAWTYLASRTCLGLGFPAYIRGLSAPLRTLSLFFSSTPSLATVKGSLGDFGSSPLNHFGFLDIWLPFSLGSSNPKWLSLS